MTVASRRALGLVVALVVFLTAALAVRFGGISSHDGITALPKHAAPRRTYVLAGTVIVGSVRRLGSGVYFAVRDPALGASVTVHYSGVIPDPFAAGRAILINVRSTRSGAFIGEPGSLTTRWHLLPQMMQP
jgi:cytochrome c-type biogenesis protein CcmE